MTLLKNAYDQLTKNHVHWDRISNNEIVVWTSGYQTAECYEIEKFLMSCGLHALSMDFDRHCGKTKTTYRHK